jgi:hypothetical protein
MALCSLLRQALSWNAKRSIYLCLKIFRYFYGSVLPHEGISPAVSWTDSQVSAGEKDLGLFHPLWFAKKLRIHGHLPAFITCISGVMHFIVTEAWWGEASRATPVTLDSLALQFAYIVRRQGDCTTVCANKGFSILRKRNVFCAGHYQHPFDCYIITFRPFSRK